MSYEMRRSSIQDPHAGSRLERIASKEQQELFLDRYDLTTASGLRSALEVAGCSWAELSRRSGVAVSTLKSRGDRLGVHPTVGGGGSASDADDDLFDEWEDDIDRPILTEEQIAEIVGWVDSTVQYLLHDAPAAIENAIEGEDGLTREMAEAIIRVKAHKRLLHIVYGTHGVPRSMLWELERRWASEEEANAA